MFGKPVAVEHVRESSMSEEEVRAALAGRGEQPELRAVKEIAESLLWRFVQEGRAGTIDAVRMLASMDAVMEFQAHLATMCEPLKERAKKVA